MRACVIFNPTAKGEKARHFFNNLDAIGKICELKHTTGPHDARRLATEAVQQGFDTVIAAGGDGTLNEVVNGLAAAPGGLERARLGFLPLGTVNVFARELGIPCRPEAVWKFILNGREKRIDLPFIETQNPDAPQRWHFAQMAGAGLDAAAIAAVSWPLKKKIGPLAYVIAGLKALNSHRPNITVQAGSAIATGELILIGNGQRYGGEFKIHPEADLTDGLLDICVFPKTNWLTLARCSLPLLMRRRLPESTVIRMRAATFTLSADAPAHFEVDGELAGLLPASVLLQPRALRVIVPCEETIGPGKSGFQLSTFNFQLALLPK